MHIKYENSRDILFIFDSEEERNLCCHRGDCYAECDYVVSVYLDEFEKIPTVSVDAILRYIGIENYADKPIDEKYVYLVWIAAGDAKAENSLEAYLSTY